MHTARDLFSNARSITGQRKALIGFEAAPVVLFTVIWGILAFSVVVPMLRQYYSALESSEIDFALFAKVPHELIDVLYILVPLLAITMFLSILFRNIQYSAIAHMIDGSYTNWKKPVRTGARFFWIVCGLLLTLTVAGILIELSGYGLDTFFDAPVMSTIITLILSLIVAMAGLFAWPAVLIAKQGIAMSLRTSFWLTIKGAKPITVVFLGIVLLQLLLVCLFGVVLGFGYYVHPYAGIIAGILWLCLFIPLRVYMHVLYVLLFISLTVDDATTHYSPLPTH